jgi:hypothetical protein
MFSYSGWVYSVDGSLGDKEEEENGIKGGEYLYGVGIMDE